MARNGAHGAGMSGANNIPLGARGSGGSLSAQTPTFGGSSLLNPSYLGSSNGSGPENPGSSGRRSKFGPPVEGNIR